METLMSGEVCSRVGQNSGASRGMALERNTPFAVGWMPMG